MTRITGVFLMFCVCRCFAQDPMQLGDNSFAQGDFATARQFYRQVEAQEKARSVAPAWTPYTVMDQQNRQIALGKYAYLYDAPRTAAALCKIARTYANERQPDKALYYYAYYLKFCGRNGVDCEAQYKEIEDYARQQGKKADSQWFKDLRKK